MQKYDNKLEPVEFWSRGFDKNEAHWHVSEKELVAAVWSMEKWAKYLYGKKFILYTDHKNLEYLHKKYDQGVLLNKKLTQWLVRMEEFDCDCYYIEGALNVLSDYLSRDVLMSYVQKLHDKIDPDNSLQFSPLLKPVSMHDMIKKTNKPKTQRIIQYIHSHKSSDIMQIQNGLDITKKHTLNIVDFSSFVRIDPEKDELLDIDPFEHHLNYLQNMTNYALRRSSRIANIHRQKELARYLAESDQHNKQPLINNSDIDPSVTSGLYEGLGGAQMNRDIDPDTARQVMSDTAPTGSPSDASRSDTANGALQDSSIIDRVPIRRIAQEVSFDAVSGSDPKYAIPDSLKSTASAVHDEEPPVPKSHRSDLNTENISNTSNTSNDHNHNQRTDQLHTLFPTTDESPTTDQLPLRAPSDDAQDKFFKRLDEIFVVPAFYALKDKNWSRYFDHDKLRVALMDDVVTSVLMSALIDKSNESVVYTIPKPYQKQYFSGQYVLKNDLLWFRPKRAYIIPPKLCHSVLSYFHQSRDLQHQGKDQMMNVMRNRVYWPGIDADCKRFIDLCEHCHLGKAVLNKKAGYMQIFEATKPFEVVHLDIVGPLPWTRTGNRYILSIMDRFSRLVKLVPLPIMTASAVAMAFRNHWLMQYGIPEKTLTDRGSNFTSLVFRVLSKLYGFSGLFTTSYHPRTNGRLERFHRYLKERLRILASELNLNYFDNDDWDIYLPNISFSYNITPNRMSKYSPYSVVFGDVIKLPIDRILHTDVDDIVEKTRKEFKSPTDWRIREMPLTAEHRGYFNAITKQQKHLHKDVQDHLDVYNQRTRDKYDETQDPPPFYRPNQIVWVDDAVGKVGNRKKMQINQRRASIIDKISENAYVVVYENGRIEPVNIDRLFTKARARRSKESKIAKNNRLRDRKRAKAKDRKRKRERDNTYNDSSVRSSSHPPRKKQRVQRRRKRPNQIQNE